MARLEIKHITGNTYYVPSPANMGLFVKEDQAVLIDSGNDSEAGRQLYNQLKEKSWNLRLIINTHSNADHAGGNAFLQKKTGCRIAATRLEAAFIDDPLLEASFLYGGFPLAKHSNKFLKAEESNVTDIIPNSGKILDTALFAYPLPGHFFDMVGVLTHDNVFFAADSIFSESIINKYKMFYIYDVRKHLETLDFLENSNFAYYVPSHAEPTKDIKAFAELNRKTVHDSLKFIAETCTDEKTCEEILRELCTSYSIILNENQYILQISSLRSHLSYMADEGLLKYYFLDGKMLWKKG
ncbi:MAG: MBL fold metallo-hydrolase [Nanoarchaeota archaeon]|nr:MBL fold metallo-hydrolase [Nanoarchaeota archaeon]